MKVKQEPHNRARCAGLDENKDEETLWSSILKELEEEKHLLSQYLSPQEKRAQKRFVTMDRRNSAICYLKRNVYPILLPALKQTFQQAALENALRRPECKFNAVDHLAYLLYNLNPAARRGKTLLYDIPFVLDSLQTKPRPNYPTHWLWSKEKAAEVIAKCVRGYAVRRRPEVGEMRNFWRLVDDTRREEDTGKEENGCTRN